MLYCLRRPNQPGVGYSAKCGGKCGGGVVAGMGLGAGGTALSLEIGRGGSMVAGFVWVTGQRIA